MNTNEINLASGPAKQDRMQFLGVALLSSLSFTALALPDGGQISAGMGGIATSGSAMTVTQQSQNLAINWQNFGIGASESVSFAQPNASAIALNRVLGADPSQILGTLSANGQVWLLNPNGVLFGSTAQVNVGGLVASTLNISDADFLAGNRTFSGNGGSVTNLGSLNADGGYVALLGGTVSNEGIIQARLGTVALGAGNQVTLDFAGDKLLNLQVDQGAINALAENKQLIQADGGAVLLSARAANALLDTVVNNTGIIEARTIDTHNGTIKLLGGMEGATVQVAGTLDASAPNGGDGGFIETSGAQVKVSDSAVVTTSAPSGQTGQWLIDPNDFTVAASGGDITGAALSANLGSSNVEIQNSRGSTAGAGNVNVNDAVTWGADTILTLTASNNVNVNASITASGANAGIALNPNTANGGEAASGAGQFNLGAGAAINLPNVSPSSTTALVIGGTSYTVINSLGSAGSTTGTDIQGMSGNPAGRYALGSNIDASATSSWNSNAGFAPVGTTGAFTGVFDGLGHTISRLTINRPTSDYVGLFGYSNGVVRNIGSVNSAITGRYNVGGLVGTNYSGTVSNSYSTGAVNGSSAVGGLAGNNYGTVSNSYSTGAVNGSNYYVGGLVGDNFGTVSNSYSTGAINGLNSVGGLVGQNGGTVSNSHYDIDQVAINGGHYVTLGGLYDTQYQDWIIHGLALNISNYASTLPFDGASGYYMVSTVQGMKDLLGFAGQPGYKFRLTANVDLSGDPGLWLPQFSAAEFDGAGHVISNLSVSFPFSINRVGLFGSIGAGTAVNNVGVEGGNVTGDDYVGGLVGFNDGGTVSNSYSTGTVNGNYGLGGLVGLNSGTISNSYSTGAVNGNYYLGGLVGLNFGGTVSNSYSTSTVTGSQSLGGLVAYNNSGTVSNSYSTGAVSGGSSISYVGGLVGINDGTVSNSYSTGAVNGISGVGGLVYNNSGTVSNSYSTGTVNGRSYVGGLAGANSGTVSNSYWDISTSGQSTSAGGTGLTTAQMMQQANFTGFDFTNTWWMSEGNTRPFLRMEYSTTINNAHQLQLMALNDAASYTLARNIDMSELSNPSGLWNVSTGFMPIGSPATPFTGAFDGLGYTITGLTINRPASDYAGLFGGIEGDGVIQNVGLVGGAVSGNSYVGGLVGVNNTFGTVSNSYSTGSVNGSSHVGGLVGDNFGTVSNSYSAGSVNGLSGVGGLVGTNSHGIVSNSYSTATVNGFSDVGGLVGSNAYGTVSNSYSTGTVNGTSYVGGLVGGHTGGITDSYSTGAVIGSSNVGGLVGWTQDLSGVGNSYSTGAVNGTTNVGGLVGWNEGTVSNSYSTGTVNGSSGVGGLVGSNGPAIISNSYSTGAVRGDYDVGGLVGWNDGIISNSYSIGAVSGDYDVGGLVGWNDGHVSTSYSTGAVSGSSYVGGLVGYYGYGFGTVSNSYWDMTTSGQSTSAGGTGLTDAQMMQQVSFTGFDFTNTWRIYEGHTYPLLRSFLTPLTVTADNVSKTYDGLSWSGPLSNVSYSDPNAATSPHLYGANTPYGNSRNAGTYSPGLWSDQQGYDISYVNGVLTVNPASLTVAATTDTKVYDGTTSSAAAPTVTGLIAGDSISGAGQAFTSRNVLGTNGSTLNVTGYTLSDGNGGANYIVSTPTATGTITPAALSISTSDVIKTYDGTTSANGTAIATAGTQLFGSDSLSGGSFAFIDKNAGANKTVTVGGVTVNDGNSGNNYLVNYADNTTSTINQALLTANIVGNPTKVYDGTTDAKLAPSSFSLTGVVSGESVVLGNTTTAGSYNSSNVSQANMVTADLSGASFRAGAETLLSNYLLPTFASGSGQITPATLTYVADSANMMQGSSVPPLSGNVTGFVAGETLGSATTGTLSWETDATPTSGTGRYYINGLGLVANYGNYVFAQALKNANALIITRCRPARGNTCP